MDQDRHQPSLREVEPTEDRRYEFVDPRHPSAHPLLLLDEELREPTAKDYLVPLGLFLLTAFTTLWAGAYQANTNRLIISEASLPRNG